MPQLACASLAYIICASIYLFSFFETHSLVG